MNESRTLMHKPLAGFLCFVLLLSSVVPAHAQSFVSAKDLPRQYLTCMEELSEYQFTSLGFVEHASSAQDQDMGIFEWAKTVTSAFLEKAVFGPEYGWIKLFFIVLTMHSLYLAVRTELMKSPNFISGAKQMLLADMEERIMRAKSQRNAYSHGSPQLESTNKKIQKYQKSLTMIEQDPKTYLTQKAKVSFRRTFVIALIGTALAMVNNYLYSEKQEKEQRKAKAPKITPQAIQGAETWHELFSVISTVDDTSQGYLFSMLNSCNRMLEMSPEEITAGDFKPYFMQ